MRILLDTHALIWWLAGDAQLSDTAHAAITDDANEIFVSAASAWEVTTRHRVGKLGQIAGALAGEHRDPFDRMLIAQAREEKMALVSNEAVFDTFGVTRVW